MLQCAFVVASERRAQATTAIVRCRYTGWPSLAATIVVSQRRYLVDPASSYMLVSKIKPCMSKYTPQHGETANGSLNQLWFLRSYLSYLDNCGNSRANTCNTAPTREGKSAFVRPEPILAPSCRKARWAGCVVVTLDNFLPIACPSGGDRSFECLPYQLSMVRAMPTMVITGNGESGFDSGEGA